MQYVSPISFLPSGTSVDTIPKDLRMAKQKMLAEFELTGNATIVANGKELTRNDVLKLFDQLELSGYLAFYALVAADPVLTLFLEQHEIAAGTQFSIPDEKATKEFVEWISPYFSWSFNKATTRMFRNLNPEEFETLIQNQWWMKENDEWEAWKGVENHLNTALKNLKAINDAGNRITFVQKKQYAGYNFIWLLCNLPVNRFRSFINTYAAELMRLSTNEFKNKRRKSALEIIGYAMSLPVSIDMQLTLKNREYEFSEIALVKKKGIIAILILATWMLIIYGFYTIEHRKTIQNANFHQKAG